MKKLLSLMLVLVLAFSLCGCEETKTDTADTAETATTQAETESEEVTEEEIVTTEETPIATEEEESETTASPVVYRTETGAKYHRESCRHLVSKIETTVEQAKALGLEACSVCKPPQ